MKMIYRVSCIFNGIFCFYILHGGLDYTNLISIISKRVSPESALGMPEHNLVSYVDMKSTNKDIAASVVVPCHPAHIKHVYPLLRSLEEQSVLPDEVVISLSEYKQAHPEIMQLLKESRWAYPVTLILSEEKLNPGQNRNLGSSKASGDVFIYQDADDQPHPQRIEVIKHLFKTYNLDLLMHRFIEFRKAEDVDASYWKHYDHVEFLCPSDYDSQIMGKDIHNGNTAISRNAFSLFKWPDFRTHEDEIYNRILYNHFGNRIIVLSPLLMYRHYLSSEYEHNLVSLDMEHQPDREMNIDKMHAIKFVYHFV